MDVSVWAFYIANGATVKLEGSLLYMLSTSNRLYDSVQDLFHLFNGKRDLRM